MRCHNALVVAGLTLGLCFYVVECSASLTLFEEDFTGETTTGFRNGLGSNGWYGVRLGDGSSTDIKADISINVSDTPRNEPDGAANKPYALFQDDAGIAFSVDVTNYTNLTLDFWWSTRSIDGSDMFRAGYYLGDLTTDPGFVTSGSQIGTANLVGTAGAWANWVEITAGTDSEPPDAGPGTHYVGTLEGINPLDTLTGPLWIVFWIDDGDGDIGQVDSIKLTGDYSNAAIPELGALAVWSVLGMTICTASIWMRRRFAA